MTTTVEILEAIHQLDDNALHEVINSAIIIHRMRRHEQHAAKVARFRSVQKVRFIGPNSQRLPHGAEGHVRKINSRTIAVDFGPALGRWRIDATLLEPVE